MIILEEHNLKHLFKPLCITVHYWNEHASFVKILYCQKWLYSCWYKWLLMKIQEAVFLNSVHVIVCNFLWTGYFQVILWKEWRSSCLHFHQWLLWYCTLQRHFKQFCFHLAQHPALTSSNTVLFTVSSTNGLHYKWSGKM